MEGKHVGQAGVPGRLVALADGHARLATASAWPAFTNLRLNLLDETGAERPGDVYAKVAPDEAPEGELVVRFTSLPAEIKALLAAAE